MPRFNKANYTYTPNFCEENIWRLGKSLLAEGIPGEALSVWILSNSRKQIPLYYQHPDRPLTPVVWDYHVILIYTESSSQQWVLDFASQLPFPMPLSKYAESTFPLHKQLNPLYSLWIREIPIADYHRYLYSDRSHMIRRDGSCISPFPPQPPILGTPDFPPIALMDYINMQKILHDRSAVFTYPQPKF
ncbi:hypothetical protein WDW89_13650 [Deltaproteobacteria bacterium TL4]